MNGLTDKFNKGIIAIVIVTLLASCGGSKGETAKGGGRPNGMFAQGYIVSPGAFSNIYTTSGTLLPNEQVDIKPEISGRVTGIHFREGASVSKGQLLVQLYDGEIKAQLEKLKAQRKLQTKTEERQKALVDIGGISQQDYEATQTQLQSIDADIAYAEAQLRATKILAPFSGHIGIRNISEGAVVTPSTVIALLQQNNPLKIDFDIPGQYVDAVRNNTEVLFSINGIQDTLIGNIMAADPGADAITRTIHVRATVPNNNNQLVAGSFANVMLPLTSSNNAILVPSQSVIPTTKDKLVAVLKDGKASMVKVVLGARTSNKVEILNGLKAGDTILTTGLMQVKDGIPVNITGITK